jgi:hypothetical protein
MGMHAANESSVATRQAANVPGLGLVPVPHGRAVARASKLLRQSGMTVWEVMDL